MGEATAQARLVPDHGSFVITGNGFPKEDFRFVPCNAVPVGGGHFIPGGAAVGAVTDGVLRVIPVGVAEKPSRSLMKSMILWLERQPGFVFQEQIQAVNEGVATCARVEVDWGSRRGASWLALIPRIRPEYTAQAMGSRAKPETEP